MFVPSIPQSQLPPELLKMIEESCTRFMSKWGIFESMAKSNGYDQMYRTEIESAVRQAYERGKAEPK